MLEKTYLRLQNSEGLVGGMAAQFVAAYISAGLMNPETEDKLIEDATRIAIKLAHVIDNSIESDDENGVGWSHREMSLPGSR